MIGAAFCLFAFWVTYTRATKSLGEGIGAFIAFFYVYGFVRARIADSASHFILDAALFGLYAARFSLRLSDEAVARAQTAKDWVAIIMAWPHVCMAYSPALSTSQPLVIQLVGLREAVLFVPFLILGAHVRRADWDTLSALIATLNLIALAFGIAEYIFGIEAIIPHNELTLSIYQTRDITASGGVFYRIPATFVASHAYGGTMVMSVPFVAHGLESNRPVRMLCWAGLAAAVIGTFLCGSRLPVVMLIIATTYTLSTLRMRLSTLFAFLFVGVAVTYLIVHLERFQRFTTLSDSDMVRNRIAMSMNMSFFDVLTTYPIGAGLATAAGTSIPYFLYGLPGIHSQFGIENEYCRIVLEEGIAGLGLWAALFVVSTFSKQKTVEASPTAAAYLYALTVVMWLIGLIGTGLLSPIFLLALGTRLAAPATPTTRRPLRQIAATRDFPRRRSPLAVPRTSG